MATVPALAEAAFLAPVTRHTRRVDIYMSDGLTEWLHDVSVTDGSVSLDYGRDERRSLDLTFDNIDGKVSYSPTGFWYDKIIKCFRGVEYQDSVGVDVLVATNYLWDSSTNDGTVTPWVAYGLNVTLTSEVVDGRRALKCLKTVDSTGQQGLSTLGLTPRPAGTVVTISAWVKNPVGSTTTSFSFIARDEANNDSAVLTSITSGAGTWNIPADGAWRRMYVTGTVKAARNLERIYVQKTPAVNEYFYLRDAMLNDGQLTTFFAGDSGGNVRWTGTAYASPSELYRKIYTSVTSTWETQVGEFMIDTIKEPHFPDIISVTGRDYTKKMLTSKFVVMTSFASGTSLETTISNIALSAGIPPGKMILPVTGKTLGKDFIFDRGVTKWEAAKTIADAYGYELFFNAQGTLTMRTYLDPETSPLAYTFLTGAEGNLVTYSKSISDTRLYNHVVVSGEASDTTPVWAQARNDNPASPTNIALIGDRLYQYVSSFITTTQQAQDVANRFLSIHSLQEYNFDFSSLMFPWLEVGEIVEFIDPKADDTQPDRFLLDTLTIPMSLGAMTGTGKRVTILG